jgi:hypothetical protein
MKPVMTVMKTVTASAKKPLMSQRKISICIQLHYMWLNQIA